MSGGRARGAAGRKFTSPLQKDRLPLLFRLTLHQLGGLRPVESFTSSGSERSGF